MRGGFVNMSLETTRRDLVRAVVEGVAHNLAWLLAAGRGVHRRTRSTRSRSSAARRAPAPWCQILADVLDRPVVALAAPDSRDRARHRAARAAARRRVVARRPRPRTDRGVDAASNPTPSHRSLFADRHGQFEAAYAALLPISEALS